MMSHDYGICRNLYSGARRSGSPVVNILRLSEDCFCGETSDGKVLKEGIKGCCKWAMKFEIAQEWFKAAHNNSL